MSATTYSQHHVLVRSLYATIDNSERVDNAILQSAFFAFSHIDWPATKNGITIII